MEVLRGVAHGKIIEREMELALPEGQRVAVTVQPLVSAAEEISPLPPGEGLRRAFGAWAEDGDELDKYLEWNRQQRKIARPEIAP
jgi:hypothetical protein